MQKLTTLILHLAAVGFIVLVTALYFSYETYHGANKIITERVLRDANHAMHEEGYRRLMFITNDEGNVVLRIKQVPKTKKGE